MIDRHNMTMIWKWNYAGIDCIIRLIFTCNLFEDKDIFCQIRICFSFRAKNIPPEACTWREFKWSNVFLCHILYAVGNKWVMRSMLALGIQDWRQRLSNLSIIDKMLQSIRAEPDVVVIAVHVILPISERIEHWKK